MKGLILITCVSMFYIMCSAPQKLTTTESQTPAQEIKEVEKITTMALPPLIDRSVFFGNPQIAAAQISPDGNWVSFLKEHNGILNLWVKKFDQPFEEARLLTNNERPLAGYFWSDDAKHILFIKDYKGDENFNLYAIDPINEAGQSEIPEAKNLTPLDEVRVTIYNVSRNNPEIAFIGINDRDPAWHDLYKVNIKTGERELLYKNENRISGWEFDWDENARLAYRTNEAGHTEIHRINDDKSFSKIYETNLEEAASVQGWNKDNSQFYLVSNKGDVDKSTLYMMNPNTEQITMIESDPKGEVDFGGIFIDQNTRELLYTSYFRDQRERHWKNDKWKKMYTFLSEQFPGKDVGFASYTNDYQKMLINVSSDQTASKTYYFDWANNKLIHQYTARPELEEVEDALSPMKGISYKSSDGLVIPAYLTIPKGTSGKNLPLVVMVHGGPKGPRDTWGYSPYVQMLANRGYAVLQPNFRASGGFGKEFLNAGDREWGKLMQDDITWGVKHLISNGTADPTRVAIMGGSYGGYATLAGLAFTPDLYTCGVDIVGPSNLFTLLESIPPYWEAFRKSLYEMVGNPETEEGQKLMRDASPLFSVDKIKKPLLIIQGANDPRVKQAESDQIVVALRDAQKEVEYLLADDEGHGFRKPINNKAMWVAAEKFLAKHLGGRFQADMAVDVEKRLEEITQDISKVTLPEKVDESKLTGSLPLPTKSIQTGSTAYKMTIELGGQVIPMDVTQTVTMADNQYTITQMAKSPMGEMKDESVIAKESMLPISRKVDQGPIKITLNHTDNQVTGEMNMNGNVQPISMDLENKVYADGPALYLTLAALPLEVGYKTVYRTFDVQTQKVKTFELEVTDEETIVVPAGEYKTYKSKVSSLDGDSSNTMLWFSAEENHVGLIKTTANLPEMGGAKMTMEMSK